MKESVGNALLFNIIIVFVVVFIGLFVTSITYSKGYKVKNKMIDVIEKTYPTCSGKVKDCNTRIINLIDSELDSIGYRRATTSFTKKTCENVLINNKKILNYSIAMSKKYQICIAAINIKDNDTVNNNSRVYYKVASYMYLDLPIIGDALQIPVRGETKNFLPGIKS